MKESKPQDAVSRRGFLQAASAAPALGLAIAAAPNALATESPRTDATTSAKRQSHEDLKAELGEYGFVVLRELIPRSDALALEGRVREIMARQPDAGAVDQHIPGFFNHLSPADDPLFVPLVSQGVCLELAQALLGDGFQMTEVGCRLRKPGAPAGPMRVTRPTNSFDRAQLPMPNVCFVLAFSWMLNDLTRDMGATYYLPFSHHVPRGPREGVAYRHAVEIEAPAGSVLIHHGGIWHGFGANTTGDQARVGLMGGYIPFWMDLVSVGWQPMKRSVRDRMPQVVRDMNGRVSEG